MLKKTILAVGCLFLFSCSLEKSEEAKLEGDWIQPIPGQTELQGISLKEGGAASSINMYTLLYSNWKREGDQLILTGSSVGNGQTLSFTDTLHIRKLTPDSLVLYQGEFKMAYSRKE